MAKLDKLEQEIRKYDLPQEIRLNKYTKIINPKLFLENHLTILRSNSGNSLYLPYYQRLVELLNYLKTKKDE